MDERISDDASLLEECSVDLLTLYEAIQELPAESVSMIQPVLRKHMEATVRSRRVMKLLLDTMSQLRLDVKYLLFDLEATRRERDDYKSRLHNTESD